MFEVKLLRIIGANYRLSLPNQYRVEYGFSRLWWTPGDAHDRALTRTGAEEPREDLCSLRLSAYTHARVHVARTLVEGTSRELRGGLRALRSEGRVLACFPPRMRTIPEHAPDFPTSCNFTSHRQWC